MRRAPGWRLPRRHPRPGSRLRRTAERALGTGLGLATVALFFAFWIVRVEDPRPVRRDLLAYFYPTHLATAAQLAQGVVPLWNPYQLCGVPWLAALQPGVLYPPNLLHAILPLRLSMGVVAASHLALAAFGAWFVARRLGLAWFSALLVALIYTARGALPPWVGTPSALAAVAWLAPGCLGALAAAEGRYRSALLWLGLATGMSGLAGHPQSSVYGVYLWLGVLIGLLLVRRAPARRWWAAGGAVVGGVALGAAIAAAQLIPAWELAREGTRNLGALSARQMLPYGSLGSPWVWLAGLLPAAGILPLSVGAVGLALLPSGPSAAAPLRGVALVALALGLISLLFALGPTTPLFDVLRGLPLLGSFRFPERILFVTDFCLALAAGVGLDAATRAIASHPGPAAPSGSPSRRLPLQLVATGAAALGVALTLLDRLRSAVFAGLLAAGALAAAVAGRRLRRAGLFGGFVLGLAALEILSGPPRWPGWAVYQDPGVVAVFHQPLGLERELSDPNARVWIVDSKLSERLPARLASVLGLHSVDDYEPANLRRQAEYFGFLEHGRSGLDAGRNPFVGRVFLLGPRSGPAALAERRRLLDLAAARFVLVASTTSSSPAFEWLVREAGLRLVGETPDLRLYENPAALPRAFATYRVDPAPPREELLARIARPGFDPRARSYVEGEPGFEPASGAPERGGDARIVRESLHEVEIEATLEAPGFVVLADSYYPGWRAFVDDREVAIRAVNHLFRGVAAPAGAHRIRFEYRPWSFLAGVSVSLVGAALWLACAISLWLHPRPSSAGEPDDQRPVSAGPDRSARGPSVSSR